MKQRVKINFKDFWHADNKRNIRQNSIFQLLSKKFDLVLSDKPDFLIYSCFGKKFLKYKCVRVFYTGENVRPNFNECDYAFSFDYPVTEKNYRLPIYRLYLQDFEQLKNRHTDDANTVIKKRFCNFLYSNVTATERIDFFQKLNQYKKVDSGGKVLNNLGYFVNNKHEFLQHYKFTIAFENTSYPGYTTEKILHPLIANSIPIYWGNPLIAKDFNPKAFVNCHEYENFEQVIDKVIEIDNDDDLYHAYLKEPVFPDNIKNQYVNECNIFRRFESIFSLKNNDLVASNTDILKYHYYSAKKLISFFRH